MPTGVYKKTKQHIKAVKIALNKPEIKEKTKKAIKIAMNKPEIKEKHKKSFNRPEVKEKMRKSHIGKKLSEKTKEKLRFAQIKKMKEQYDNKTIKWCNTDIEILMYEGLLSEGYIIAKQYYIDDIGFVDFYLLEYNIIIECDGEYWHNYPYGTNNDKKRDKKLKKLGYNLLRFWGNEIKKDLNGCLNKIKGNKNGRP